MASFDLAFEQVQQLVNTFQQNYNHYMSAGYSESAARTDFIDKFFTALGWDVNHTTQTNPYEQEVKIEKSQSQQNEGARKRADYAFYTAPNFKDEVFFCEAKKPSVLIHQNPQHYFQTIKYGWNSGCPISVLTDFEEFVIIDCRNKPDLKFALNGKHKTYRFTDYAIKEKFAEIYWLFSREAVGSNSLQKYAEQLPKAKGKAVQKALFKGGYQAIDDSFLEYIDGIRENNAKAFKKANPELNSEQLTEATQRTVDRLVFIRFLEDKFIETEEHVSEWTSWKDFIIDCRKLDAKYNGVVFKKHFIDEADFIGADEKLFLDICSDISNLNSPYDFNYIPIHILGSIYERFLGKVVRTTDKRVFVEDKPEVRKAGGVYYTPKYIVDYIVKNTVGKIIEGLAPKEIAEKRFADIACGSGSFLIGVYDYLLDYHKKYYTEKLSGKTEIDGRSEDFGNVEYKDGQWTLTLKLKQDILLNNIYGVDIDAQAVEVTQLSLFLKMLEEENVSSTQIKQGALFSKVLPDLSKNIVCGNSLISWDIMNGQLFEDEELKKLNPMDYEAVFPATMRNGGFDAVVGNPPWGAELSDLALKYLKAIHSKIIKRMIDTYIYFINHSLKITKDKGLYGVIIPSTFLNQIDVALLREKLINSYDPIIVVNLGEKIFGPKVLNTSTILVVSNSSSQSETIVVKDLRDIAIEEKSNYLNNIEPSNKFEWLTIVRNDSNFIFQTLDNSKNKILMRLKQIHQRFENIIQGEIQRGISPDYANAFILSDEECSSKKIESEITRPLVLGKHINRYGNLKSHDKILYLTKKDDINKFPNAKEHLIQFRKFITCKEVAEGKHPWYSLHRPRNPEIFEGVKFIGLTTSKQICLAIDYDNYYATDALYLFKIKKEVELNENYVLGILHSKIFQFLYNINVQGGQRVIPQIKAANLYEIPFPTILKQNGIQKNIHDKIISLVTQILESKKQLASAKTDGDKNFLQNKCNSLDRQIDNLVYELYGLTDEEIKMVEAG